MGFAASAMFHGQTQQVCRLLAREKPSARANAMPQGDRSEPVTGPATTSAPDAQASESRLAELWEEFRWHIAEYAAYHEREAALERQYPSHFEFATEAEWEAAVTSFRTVRGLLRRG